MALWVQRPLTVQCLGKLHMAHHNLMYERTLSECDILQATIILKQFMLKLITMYISIYEDDVKRTPGGCRTSWLACVFQVREGV